MAEIVIAGANGFVGQVLAPALVGHGHRVRCGSRRPHQARRTHRLHDWVELDLDRPATLDRAFAGAEVVVLLVRAEREQTNHLLRAAERAGVQHVLAVTHPGAEATPVLERDPIPSTVLETQALIGEGSEGWTAARDLGLRVPLLVRPPWFDHRVQPLWQGDLQAAVCHAVAHRIPGVFGLPGPRALSAEDMIHQVASLRRMRPLRFRLTAPIRGLSALWLRMFTRVEGPVAQRIVDELSREQLLDEPGYWAHFEHERLPFDHAARRMLRYEHKPARLPERYLESFARRAAGGDLKRVEPDPHH